MDKHEYPICDIHHSIKTLGLYNPTSGLTERVPVQVARLAPDLLAALKASVEDMMQYIPKAAKGHKDGCFKYAMGGADMWNCQCPICKARTVIAKAERKEQHSPTHTRS